MLRVESEALESKGLLCYPQLGWLGSGIYPNIVWLSASVHPTPTELLLQVAHIQASVPPGQRRRACFSHITSYRPTAPPGKPREVDSSHKPHSFRAAACSSCQESDKASGLRLPSLPPPRDLLTRPCLSTQLVFISFSLRETEARSRT